MNSKMALKKSLLILFFAIPVLSYSQTNVATQEFDLGSKIILGLIVAVILGALLSIYNLFTVVYNKELERTGIEMKKKHGKPFLERWKEKLTNMVPVESEKSILLNHNYDGIQELDNNLPPWWLYGFYASVVFGVFYIGYFHYYGFGLDSKQAYEYEVKQAAIGVAKHLELQANRIDESNLVALTDKKNLSYGKALFINNCVACHLESGGGSPTSVGPNLTDQYWIHGGDIKSVFKTIKYGVPAQGMIAWKAQLKPADIHRLASYVLSIQGTNPANAKEPQGDLFVEESMDTPIEVKPK